MKTTPEKRDAAHPKRTAKPKSAPAEGRSPDSRPVPLAPEITGPPVSHLLPATDHLPLTANMEVHHHPEVEKKGLKEYLLEGLMIFVAVTMGFFAESLREHINERQHAKEFAASMYVDLKADTTNLADYIKRIDIAARNVDTLFMLLSANDPKNIPSGKLYWYGLFGGTPSTFSPHDATLLEMKSSGSLRYFSQASLDRMVAEYDQLLEYYKTAEEHKQGIYTEVRKARAQLFDFKYNDAANNVAQRIYKKNNWAAVDSFVHTRPPLLTYDKILFNQYVEMVRSRFLRTQLGTAKTLKEHAAKLIIALKKQYELDDEEEQQKP
jgi:hypothetical protein